jgi:hypothetical protein
MNARNRLFDAYAEWRRWTVEEGDAIQASDWPKVRSCQRAKLELQPRIIRCTEDARTESRSTGDSWLDIEKDLRREVAGLIELETRNGQTLAQVRCKARAEQAELDRSTRQLKQIRSYAPVTQTAWSSYS